MDLSVNPASQPTFCVLLKVFLMSLYLIFSHLWNEDNAYVYSMGRL